MSRQFRILAGGQNPTTTVPPPPPANSDSDFTLILTAFLCALICILGMVAMARCSRLRHMAHISATGRTNLSPPSAANKRLKKKVLKTLPTLTYSTERIAETVADCAICLTEFETGDEIRILPICGHGFHVACIDTWFGSHSSCPSCRQILTPAPRCKKCGELPVAGVSRSVATAGRTSGSIHMAF